MKKVIIMSLLYVLFVAASAQAATSFSKNYFKDFTLHTYVSDDPLGDVSFIIESKNKLVILEPQAFNKNITELNEYAAKLNKPLATVLVSYHAGGVNNYDDEKVITKPMDGFMHSEHGQGMVEYFTKIFKGQMDLEPAAYDKKIAANAKLIIDGVTYQYFPSAVPGMPGSNISINGEVLYTHFAPAVGFHVSEHLINSKASIDGALADAKIAQQGNYEIYVGSHFPGKGTKADVAFLVDYLQSLKKAAGQTSSAADIIKYMNNAYPNLKNNESLEKIAASLTK